jgi:hypothetical protein
VPGALIGVRSGDGSIDTNARGANAAMSVSGYYQSKPWRRSYFVLNATTGQEQDYAPFIWLGSQSGNRFRQSSAVIITSTRQQGSIIETISMRRHPQLAARFS